MTFTFKDSDGKEVQDVRSCRDCIYCSTKNHFSEVDGELACPLCKSTDIRNL